MDKNIRKHYMLILSAGYRIYFYKDILTIKKCARARRNVLESIKFLILNKEKFKRFVHCYIETYRRKSSKKDGCFIHDTLKEFRTEKDYLNILAVDVYNDHDIEIICIKKQFMFKKYMRKNDSTVNTKISEEWENILKYFPNINDGKEFQFANTKKL